MPTAKLLKPNSLTMDGRRWKRGVVEPVTINVAMALLGNERFLVEGLDASAIAEHAHANPVARPKGKALHAVIVDAIDEINPDDEDAYAANGLPTAAAISKVLGYDVTTAEVLAATGKKAVAAAQAETLAKAAFTPAAKAAKAGVKITRVAKVVADVVPADPTTAIAVEV
jgi:hypothetical protein